MKWANALAILSGLVVVTTTFAQDVNLGGLRLRHDEVMSPPRNDYNIMIGDLALAVRYVGYLSYDDNPNQSPENSLLYPTGTSRSQDSEISWMLSNGLDVVFDLPITPNIDFHGDFLIEYLYALSGDENDGWQLGGSELFGNNVATFAVDLLRTDRQLLTISDQLSVERTILDLNHREHATNISYWKNTAAVQYEYAISPLIDLGLYYGYQTAWTDEEDMDYLGYESNIYGAKLKFQVNPDLTIEPFVTYTNRNYDRAEQTTLRGYPGHIPPVYVYRYTFANNDYTELTYGVSGDWKLGPTLELEYVLGYQELDFDDNRYIPEADEAMHSRVIDPATDNGEGTPFGKLTLKHELTANYLHQVFAGYNLTPILTPEVNYSRDASAGYSFDWRFHWHWRLEGGFTYTHSRQSDRQGGNNHLYSEYLAITYIVSPKATVSLVAERHDQDSDEIAQEYDQTRLGLHWDYKF